jgi:hypothetical protein
MKTEQVYHHLIIGDTRFLYKAYNPCIPCEIVVKLVAKNYTNRKVLNQSP